jgi:hypothetical protein
MIGAVKKERYYIQNQQAFDEGKLTIQMLKRIPSDLQYAYVKKEIRGKYKKDAKVECFHCGVAFLFDEGVLTDEELYELRPKENVNRKVIP